MNYNDIKCGFEKKFIDMMNMKNFSQDTIKSYYYHWCLFKEFKNKTHVTKLSSQDVNDYLIYSNTKNLSSSYYNQSINAIRFFFIYVLNKKIKNHLVVRPKKEQKLPEILSEQEVIKVIKTITNLKHKTVFVLLYSTGLRLNELIHLKFKDIDRTRMIINVKQGKGKKDRQVSLEPKVLELLEDYYKSEDIKPIEYVFNGQKLGKPYAKKSIQNIVKDSCLNANIIKNISPHKLRHSCGTHLRNKGVDLAIIQDLFGHNSPKSTRIYAKLSNERINNLPKLTESF